MNELIFLCSIFIVSISILGALKLGKEALIGLLCIQVVLVNLFISKEITLFGLTATGSDALAVGCTLTLNTVQEYYQKTLAQKAIIISALGSFFYVILALLHIAYTPAPLDVTSACFSLILTPMPRIVIASLGTYLLVQYFDSFLYNKLSILFHKRFFILRNYVSASLTQLLDTLLFSFLGLYKLNQGFSTVSVIFHIIIVSYIIKLCSIILSVPFLALMKKIYRYESL